MAGSFQKLKNDHIEVITDIINQMLHLFIQDSIQGDEKVITDKEQLHHLTGVCRARQGDAISLFDRQGNSYYGKVSLITKTELRVHIESCQAKTPSRFHLTIACAIPKASGMDEIIDQLTQLGADTILPMITERVVAKPYEPEKKLERWHKIAISAAEQSQRNTLPDIPAVLSLPEVMERTRDHNLRLIPTLEGDRRSLSEAMRDFSRGRVVILIGPEGDFTAQEVKIALEAGFIPVSLGKNVLRVDTAALAVTAFIRLSLPDA